MLAVASPVRLDITVDLDGVVAKVNKPFDLAVDLARRLDKKAASLASHRPHDEWPMAPYWLFFLPWHLAFRLAITPALGLDFLLIPAGISGRPALTAQTRATLLTINSMTPARGETRRAVSVVSHR